MHAIQVIAELLDALKEAREAWTMPERAHASECGCEDCEAVDHAKAVYRRMGAAIAKASQ